MIPGLKSQASQALLALVLGLALGSIYDGGRAWRRVFPGLRILADIVVGLWYFLFLAAMAIYTGGLRFYELFGLTMGAAFWFFTLGPPLLRVRTRLLLKIRSVGGRLRRKIQKTFKILRKPAKKFFPSGRKWSTIRTVPFFQPGVKRREGVNHDKNHSDSGLRRPYGNLGRLEHDRPVSSDQ